ncbi:MAG TPA: PSD1 and planctomycete cytochrome C domain-containing protein [Terriglobia bacterium]|nr:PSD1 and planctomycete cytochrome C domain-containing protein [Terriglobia bacterium]
MKRLFLLLVLVGASGLTVEGQTGPQQEFFESKIRPVLAQQCYACHTDEKMGGLRLDSREGVSKVVVPGDPDQSLLISAIHQTGNLKMPKGGTPLSEAQVADFSKWIKDGAYFPESVTVVKTEATQKEFFESRIRPLLAQQCFICHTNSKSGGLRLDSRDDILKGGKSGPAIVPGDAEKSLLIAAIKHSGELKMPKGAVKLTDDQITDMTAWVKDGAFWPVENTAAKKFTDEQRHLWSIQPLAKPEIPKVKDAAWPLNDLDRLVLAKLEKEGLKPAAMADRRTLLRRVTYDLTGLPPTYEELKAFEADKSPNAYEKVIDRLLASPRYGERWARHWMDVVRYGEDDYRVAKQPDRVEKYPFAYLYRDWLIKSFNEDIPYDQFIKAQLAADLLDEKTRPSMIPALGMHGTGVWSYQDNPAPIERADEWHDKVDVTTKAFLGLTVGCARCHDHKYDAIPQRDYYSLASVFASSHYKAYPQVDKPVVDEYEKASKQLEGKEKDLKKFLEQASDLYAQMLFAQSEDYMVAAFKVGNPKSATVQSVADDSKLDAELLDRWVKFLKKKPINYSFLKPWQDMVGKGGTAEEAKKLAHEFYLKVSEVNEKYFKLKQDNEIALAQFKNEEQFDPLPNGLKRQLNKHQIDLKGLDREETYVWRDIFDQDLPELGQINVNADDKKKPGLLKLTDWALEKRLSADLAGHVTRAKAGIEAFKKSMPKPFPFVYGLEEEKEPSDLKVFVRGNPYAFGEEAPRAYPSIFTEGQAKRFEKGSGRLELAEMISKEPVTARVIANRIWRWHMGRGITDTPNNFGIAGERPTNPELLEYLASKFLSAGMSWKKLHKEILMSRTYQLSSTTVEANLAKDQENRFFWRANRQRLEAEGIWDSLLTASGKLDLKQVGGASEELGEKMVRRAVYATVSRMYPNDFQMTFDLPTPTISAERRYITNVPQQRLFFLNNSFVYQQAEELANRITSETSQEAQITKAFQIAYQRVPTPEELKASIRFLRDAAQQAAPPSPAPAAVAGPVAKPLSSGSSFETALAMEQKEPEKQPAEKPSAEKTAAAVKDSPLQSFCWALLSSNEFLFID